MLCMSDDTEWPLGPALERGRVERGMATREAARRAGLSDTAWRNLERGYELKRGVKFPVSPKPETVAAAARVAGVAIDAAFKLANIDLGLVQHHDQQPVDLSVVSDEQLLEEVRRRIIGNRAPTAQEVAANPDRYVPLQAAEDAPRRRKPGR
jgi:transcriptional regulator with XRE-family HTH domain